MTEYDNGDEYWAIQIDELNRRRAFAEEMGGTENVARQHAAGRLTVRERIQRITDDRSFREIGTFAGTGEYDDDLKISGKCACTYTCKLAESI